MKHVIIFLLCILCFSWETKGQNLAVWDDLLDLMKRIAPAELSEQQKVQCEDFFRIFREEVSNINRKWEWDRETLNEGEEGWKEIERHKKNLPMRLKKLLTDDQYRNYITYSENQARNLKKQRFHDAMKMYKQEIPSLTPTQEMQLVAYLENRDEKIKDISNDVCVGLWTCSMW